MLNLEIAVGNKMYLFEVEDFDLDAGFYEVAALGSAKDLGYVDHEAWEVEETEVFVTMALVGGDLCETRTFPISFLTDFLVK